MNNLPDKELRSIIKDLKPTFLHTPTFEEQGKIIVMLGSLGDERCINPLSQMLSHRDENLRILAINSLIKIRSEKIFSILRQCLTDESPAVRDAAKTSLEIIG